MTRKKNNPLQELQSLRDLWAGFQASRVILTANNLGVFEQLGSPMNAADLARHLNTDPRATEILLDAVASLGLIKKTGGSYRNAVLARRFLVKDSPLYQGDMLRHADHLWKSWSGLDEVVRTGKPNRTEGRDYGVFIRAMHNNSVMRAKDVVNAIEFRNVKTALDLGGGPGTYSIELARKKITVTLFDLPEAIEVAKEIVGQSGAIGVRFLPGDFHSDDIGKGYDLVFISQIFHSMPPDDCMSLLHKVRDSLNPKGRVAIHEFALAADRAAPPSGALFSINMLVNTESGRSYTTGEMKSWLAKTGFSSIKIKPIGTTVLTTGTKNRLLATEVTESTEKFLHV